MQVSPKLLSWNTVVGSKEVQETSVYLHFSLFSSRENVAKNKEGCSLWGRNQIESLVFDVSKSPVRQQVPDHVCKKSINSTIDSQQTIIFGGRSWTFFVWRRNFDSVPKMWGDTV